MDGLSAAVAVISLIDTARRLASEGYKYIKAVKNCDQDVQRLIGEISALEGLLHHVEKLFSEKEAEEAANGNILPVPTFYYEFQQTFTKISLALQKFDSKSVNVEEIADETGDDTPSNSSPVITKSKKIDFARLIPSRFKWPLDKLETMALVESLERHKSKCLLALTTEQWADVRQILGLQRKAIQGEAKVYKEISEVKSMLKSELERTQTQKILTWLYKHDPTEKHQQTREIHQDGTGEWVFGLDEYQEWASSESGGLWIHGIPGAGKTVLASLIIERLYESCPTGSGTAFYYCQYQTAASQEPSNILGWWIKSLAEQQLSCLERVKSFYAEFHPPNKPPKKPKLRDLELLLHDLCKHFSQVTLALDGLDECGVSSNTDRSELLPIVARLLFTEAKNCRLLVTSRLLQDIEKQFSSFSEFSLHAKSADLQMYVTAELYKRSVSARLRFQDDTTRTKVTETLISRSEGMFMWCKCRIDYLCTLPTDDDRVEALNDLPRGLHATYIRILETIDRDLSPKTVLFIKRALKWLSLQGDTAGHFDLTLPSLVHAVSTDPYYPPTRFNARAIPHQDDLTDWLGSLVRVNKAKDRLEFGHFSVKDFLESEPVSVDSVVARQYLVQPHSDMQYLAQSCLAYLSFEDLAFEKLVLRKTTLEDILSQFPFYGHAAMKFPDYICEAGCDFSDSAAFQRFFTINITGPFATWTAFAKSYRGSWGYSWNPSSAKMGSSWITREGFNWRPLQVASALLLPETVRRLLAKGAKTNEAVDEHASPLHLAVGGPSQSSEFFSPDLYSPYRDAYMRAQMSTEDQILVRSRRVELVCLLLKAGAAVNQLSKTGYQVSKRSTCEFTPLLVAIFHLRPDLARILLDYKAEYQPVIGGFGKDYDALEKTIQDIKLEKGSPEVVAMSELVELLISLPGVEDVIHRLLAGRDPVEKVKEDDESASETSEVPLAEGLLNAAAIIGNVELLDWAIAHDADLNYQEDGHTPLCVAVENSHPAFATKLEANGASRYTLCEAGDSAVVTAFRNGGVEYARTIFGSSVDVEIPDTHKIEVLRAACNKKNNDLVEFMVEMGVPRTHELRLSYDIRSPLMDVSILEAAQNHGLLSRDTKRLTFAEAWKSGDAAVADYLLGVESAVDLVDTTDIPELTRSNEDVFLSLAKADVFDSKTLQTIVNQAETSDFKGLRLRLILRSPTNDWTEEHKNGIIHLACSTRDAEAVRLALDAGYSPSSKNAEGQTPMHLAAENYNVEIMELLIRHDTDLLVRDDLQRTILHSITESMLENWSYPESKTPDNKAAKMIPRLIEAGIDGNAQEELSQNTALHQTAKQDCPKSTLALLSCGVSQEIYNDDGWFAIHAAAFSGANIALKAMTSFENQSRLINAKTRDGWAALHLAAGQKNEESCKILIEAGANVNIVNPEDTTPLHSAAYTGHVKCARILLDAGADIEAKDIVGQTPLCIAASQGHSSMVTLLASTADLSVTDNKKWSAVHLAARGGHYDALHALLSTEASSKLNSVTSDGSTPLHLAVLSKDSASVKLLIERGANVNAQENSGATPLDICMLNNIFIVIPRILKDAGGVSGDALGARVANRIAFAIVAAGSEKRLTQVLDQGANVDVPVQNGFTPLILAAALGKTAMVKMLHEHGSDLFQKTSTGESVLMQATRGGFTELCLYLLQNGLSPYEEDLLGQTAFHIACSFGYMACLELFVKENGLDKSVLTKQAESIGTPLAAAAAGGHLELVRSLVVAGASLDGRQIRYGTPLTAACVSGRKEVVEFLLEKGAAVNSPGMTFASAIEAAKQFHQNDIVNILERHLTDSRRVE